jgi:hypothetical protein
MPTIYAGFDRISHPASNQDTLVTAGLSNCIAVVAHNASANVALMAHINTSGLFTKSTWMLSARTSVGGRPLEAQDTAWQKAWQRAWMRKVKLEFMEHAPAGIGSTFHVGLGALWGSSMATAAMRYALVDAIYDAFYVNPAVIGGTVRYIAATQVMEAQQDSEYKPWLSDGWEKEGVFEFSMIPLTYSLRL